MKPRKMTSSFSNREKMRRNPFSRRTSRSTSLRRLYSSRSYSQGHAGSCAEDPPERTPTSAPAGVSRCPRMPDPSTKVASRAGLPGAGAAYDPRAHHGLGPATANTSPLFKHPQQSDESWWSSPRGICRWPGARFVSRPRPVGMTLHDGTVHRNRRQLGPPKVFLLEVVQHPVEAPGL